ncbi:SfnB family sulfur acquisition oxidoreductase [Rhizobium rhizogenes]|uniref:SfnB family sulfur acquisition oxidoreductase n=1 Tax=Rhizobium rhizogenes TaxID=359 RepID=UPI000646ED7C|nr:SfnB family sulfur acquisition oxidoreductase [Rhizobium rhizogenes]
MGTVSQLHEHVRPLAHRIQSEEEALQIARSLADLFAQQASDRDINRVLPYEEAEALSQSGLLGITTPSEYDGLDISNSILAEIIAILAEADPSIAEIARNHFYVLEALRTGGSEEQKDAFFARALAGDRFGNALSETETTTAGQDNTRLTSEGPGRRINGRKSHAAGVLFADWIAISALDTQDELTISLAPRGTEGIQIIDDWDGFGQRTSGSGTTILHNVYVGADAVLAHYKDFERPTTVGPVDQIIHAGINLGIARAAFAETVEFVKTSARPWMASGVERAADDPLTIATIGQIAIRLEAAAALLERAGRKIDTAQINPTDDHVIDATLAVAAAKVLTTEIAIEASNALFELAGTSSTRIGLNLDRHWRNARTHTLQDPTRWKYHLVGNYHLNGITPPKNWTP